MIKLAVRDTVSAARAVPLQFSTLRASITAGSPRGLFCKWQLPLVGDNLNCEQHQPHLPNPAPEIKSDIYAAFATTSVAERWLYLSNGMRASFNDRSLDSQARTEALAYYHRALIELLRDARCSAVHRVLDAMLTTQPSLLDSRCVIYALISPLLSKCYVGAVGFKGPRPPIRRWLEHMSLAKLWDSKTSRHKCISRRPALYTALAYAGLGNVVMAVLALPPQHALGSVERSFIRLMSPVYNWVASRDADKVPGVPLNMLGSATCDDLLTLAARSEMFASSFMKCMRKWATSLPRMLFQGDLRAAVLPVWRRGLLVVRIDRSPGRVAIMCREAWRYLQDKTFFASPRYCATSDGMSETGYAESARNTLKAALADTGSKLSLRKSKDSGRPYGYWTLKNKSRLSGERMLIKVRPIISHFFHPGRHVLHKVGRALSILVDMATNAVQGIRPAHVAMWRLHEGSRRWIEQLVRAHSTTGCAEFDVEDCFLNTPREMVMDALNYWLSYQFRRTRQQPYFSISKDSKKADHRGKPCSTHFWEISAETVKAVVDWELRHNSTLAVVDASGIVRF